MNGILLQAKIKVTLRLTVSQSWRRAPIRGSGPGIYYCLTVTFLLLWCALSDERTGLPFVRVIVCVSKPFATILVLRIFTFYMLNMLINVYKIYTGPLSAQARYSRFCPISSSFCYHSLVTRTAVCLTVAKFNTLRPSAHMQFLVERFLADNCARSWRPNDCRGTCAHIQFRVVHNYANEQSISRSFRHFSK
jgi:hypothetical protein